MILPSEGRTIHDMALIKKIYDHPELTIGQRSQNLFFSYCTGFDMYRQLNHEADIKKQLAHIPSIYDFIEKKYKLRLGSRHWTAPIRYYCEDERQLFDETMKHIFEYENNYPLPEGLEIRYSPVNTNKPEKPYEEGNYSESNLPGIPELQILLGHIGYRPQMYFGASTMASLRAFLDGYYAFKEQYKLPLTAFEELLKKFIDKYKKKRTANATFKTWDRNYRWTWDLSVYGTNEDHAIPKFLSDLEKFTKTKINPEIDWNDRSSWKK